MHRGFRIPLRLPFRGVTERQGILLGGPSGWGEFSPFPGYSDGKEAPAWRAAFLSATEPWPSPLRRSVQVHVSVPEVSPEQAAEMVAASGCRAAKVKVGDAGEEGRVEAVRGALGRQGALIIDANGRWDFDLALQRIRCLGRYGVDLVEQPVATAGDMGRLRRTIDLPVAADELVGSVEDARYLAKMEAADVLVLKVQSMGGVNEGLRAVQGSGLPAVVSSPVETSVGIAAGLALAAALPELPFSCGLGTLDLLGGDVVREGLYQTGGELHVRRPEPDESLLVEYGWDPPASFSAYAEKGPQA